MKSLKLLSLLFCKNSAISKFSMRCYFSILFFNTITFFPGISISQTPIIFNEGALFYAAPGAFMIVKNGSVQNDFGNIDNGGTIEIEGDMVNNDAVSGGGTMGIFDIHGNWVNNQTFTADSSTVNLVGDNQLLTGSSSTQFFDLVLLGTGIKRQTIDQEVTNELQLNDRELATDATIMLVSNADVGAISRTTGFVSSTDIGRLERAMNQTATYVFPVGSSVGTTRYRPVEIVSASAKFGVRLANVDASIEGFERTTKDPELCIINPDFYHRIYRLSGVASADISIFFDPVQDGAWSTIAHWQNTPQWEDLDNASFFQGNPLSSLIVNSWNDFTETPFALANTVPLITLSNDTTIVAGEVVQITATVSPDSITLTWTPNTWIDCDDCLNPVASPEETTTYILVADNGCVALDSIKISVVAEIKIGIPSAFTPNGDGQNDDFNILGNNIEKYKLFVFNRWGQKVFETSDQNMGWDGKLLGTDQPSGTYVYYTQIKLFGNDKEVLQSGSVSLLR